jgi:putative aldouronate transport system permease protein
MGFSSIIFLAAIASIDQEMYEAADIDGATRLQKMWSITISSIKPTIAMLFVFTAGGLLNANFDQIMMLTNQMGISVLRETADVISTFVYRLGISNARFSFGSAAGLFQAVFNFILLLLVNKASAKMADAAVI